MAESGPTLNGLAAAITQAASTISSYVDKHNLSAPSFAEDGPESYPLAPEVQSARLELWGAATDLLHLALGPQAYSLMYPIFSNHDNMVLDVLNQFDFWSAIPAGGSATYSEIVQATKLPDEVVRRILRYAFTMRVFAPVGRDAVKHTATSAYILKTPQMRSMISHNIEEVRISDYYFPESLRRFSVGKPILSQEIHESGWGVADIDKTGKLQSFWDYLERQPEGKPEGFRANRFAEAMQIAAAASGFSMTDYLRDHYDWASLGEAKVIDMGGSSGHDAVILAKAFPKLSFVVQDRPELEASFRSLVPQELSDRVTFQGHDFFTPQPVKADVYLVKQIFHDWPDKYVIKILENITPHLKSGSRLVMYESVFPSLDAEGKYPLPPAAMRSLAATDLQMLSFANAVERTLEEWHVVVKKADERFDVRVIAEFPESLRSIIEVAYK